MDENLPPGQYKVRDWPILTAGRSSNIDLEKYSLVINGLVENPVTLSYQDILKLPSTKNIMDFHCVTTWSLLQTEWTGVLWSEIEKLVKPKPEAKYLLQYSDDEIEYTTGATLEDIKKQPVVLAYEHDGKQIPAEHGGPIRLIIPQLYAYKSAKWLKRIEFLPERKLGYWEVRGYSELADPWNEQRYTEDDQP